MFLEKCLKIDYLFFGLFRDYFFECLIFALSIAALSIHVANALQSDIIENKTFFLLYKQ